MKRAGALDVRVPSLSRGVGAVEDRSIEMARVDLAAVGLARRASRNGMNRGCRDVDAIVSRHESALDSISGVAGELVLHRAHRTRADDRRWKRQF